MTILDNNKQIVKRHFTKAIDNYDNNAKAQNIISNNLFKMICAAKTDYNGGQILEFGCGTGNLSYLLHSNFKAQLFVNDICPKCDTYIRTKIKNEQRLNFICADAEQLLTELINKGEKFDLITSSSTIQWLYNPLEFIKNCKKILKPGGIIAFSSFLPDNFKEIRAIEGDNSMLKYNSLNDLKKIISENYLMLNIESDNITLYFENPRQVLEHLKLTGVNASEKTGWSKGKLENFYEQYEKHFKNNDGLVQLSYKPVYFCAQNC